MELIIEKGYYLSDASHFVDYHAGLKFEKMNYSALWFLDDITVMSNGKADDVIFSKEDFMISNIKATYELNDEELTVYFNKGGEFEVVRKFHLVQNGQLMDEDDKFYDFKYWE